MVCGQRIWLPSLIGRHQRDGGEWGAASSTCQIETLEENCLPLTRGLINSPGTSFPERKAHPSKPPDPRTASPRLPGWGRGLAGGRGAPRWMARCGEVALPVALGFDYVEGIRLEAQGDGKTPPAHHQRFSSRPESGQELARYMKPKVSARSYQAENTEVNPAAADVPIGEKSYQKSYQEPEVSASFA